MSTVTALAYPGRVLMTAMFPEKSMLRMVSVMMADTFSSRCSFMMLSGTT